MYEVYVSWKNTNRTWYCQTSRDAFQLMDVFEQQGATSLHIYPKIPFFYDEWRNHRLDVF